MSNFPGLGTHYDTAWLSGGIWVARDNSDSPILAYNASGLCVGDVEGSLIGGAAAGLTVDGSGYLWASNPDNDTIYQLSVTTGVEEGGAPLQDPRTISLSGNPFFSSVVITANGFGGATLDIFDLTGRRVENAEFSDSFTWDASAVPAGAYYVRISDTFGSETARMVKLD